MKKSSKEKALAGAVVRNRRKSRHVPSLVAGPARSETVKVGVATSQFVDAAKALASSPGLGFGRVQVIPGSTYQDNSTIIIAPMRGVTVRGDDGKDVVVPLMHYRVTQAWMSLLGPMNQKRHMMVVVGDEVGHAYNNAISQILAHPELKKWKYILTLEDDNLPPPDAHIRLLESIEWGKYDAISGLYFTKGDFNMPMAYGSPEEYQATGVLDFKPRDVRAALAAGNIMRVNGIACGCALWRIEMFRQLPPPWFVTLSDVTPTGPAAFTQDLYFCKKAVQAGKTFAVDLRVKVGHMDVNTGVVY